MENAKGLGPHFIEVLIPQTRVSRAFVDSFVYVTNTRGSIVHFCERQCTHEIDMHIRVKEGTVIDYEWLRSFVQLDKNRVVTNPKIVGYVVRGVLFTIGEKMTCPIPPDNYDILIHADGSWERCALVCPEDDVVQPYIDSLPKDVQATFEPEASAYWDNDHCSVHEAVRVSNSPLWAIE